MFVETLLIMEVAALTALIVACLLPWNAGG